MQKMNRKFLIAVVVLGALLSFGLGLLNSYVRLHGGSPMDPWQISLMVTPLVIIGVLLAHQMRGNRAPEFATAQEEKRAKEFAADPQRAGVYLFRDAFYGKLIGIEVECNGTSLGQTRGKTFFRLDLAPGDCALVCKNPQNNTQASITLNLAAGQLIYLAQEVSMGAKGINQTLSVRPEIEGKKRVRRCRMLRASGPVQ